MAGHHERRAFFSRYLIRRLVAAGKPIWRQANGCTVFVERSVQPYRGVLDQSLPLNPDAGQDRAYDDRSEALDRDSVTG